MPTEHSLAAAWDRLRETATNVAAEYRADGHTVVEAYADHGTVRSATGEPLTFVFTVPDDAVTGLQRTITTTQIHRTEIQYVDTDGYRLYVLDIHQSDDSAIALVAGGIQRKLLQEYADTTGQAQTVVRSLDNTIALKLQHDMRTPFLTGLR